MKNVLVLLFIFIASCNDMADRRGIDHAFTRSSQSTQEQYYVRTSRERDDTLDVIDWPRPDSTFNVIAMKKIDSHFGMFEIIKYSNEPGAATDERMELFYERSIGMIYSRSLAWPEYVRIHFNNDSLNQNVAFVIDRILADPKFCNFPYFDSAKQKLLIKKFKTPKIEE